MELFDVRLVGINAETGHKLLLTIGVILAVLLLRAALVALLHLVTGRHRNERLMFVILRGNTFTVGDRITMGGVRGDVIALTFMQTKIMEMGQPPSVQGADPAMWVRSRQFTGRIVTVTNDKVFDEPVYNYTREFPFIWEEMVVPIPYRADQARAEAILLAAVAAHTEAPDARSEPVRRALERRYFISVDDLTPRVFYRLTDNWVELTVRFIVQDHGIREVKDAIARDVLREFRRAGLEVASTTLEVTRTPRQPFSGGR